MVDFRRRWRGGLGHHPGSWCCALVPATIERTDLVVVRSARWDRIERSHTVWRRGQRWMSVSSNANLNSHLLCQFSARCVLIRGVFEFSRSHFDSRFTFCSL